METSSPRRSARDVLGRPPYTLTIHQAARVLEMKEGTLRSWIAYRWVRPLKVGRHVRFTGNEIQRIMRIRKETTQWVVQHGVPPTSHSVGIALHRLASRQSDRL